MYYVLYDRDFNTLGKNGTRKIETYRLQERSYDFSALKIVGAEIDKNISPFWVSVNNSDGSIKFMTLFGVASTEKNNKTSIEGKDLKTIFNTDIVLDFENNTFTHLSAMLQYIWTEFREQIDVGFPISEFDTSSITDIEIVSNVAEGEKKVYNVWNLLASEIYYYNIHLEYSVDPYTKKIRFIFAKNDIDVKDIQLSEFGIDEVEKVIGDVNVAVIWNNALTEKLYTYYLYNDNTIGTNAESSKRIYPAKAKIYSDESVNESVKNAIMDLALARYYENININITEHQAGARFKDVGFRTSFRIYAPDLYKTLPIGEIETDEKGSKIIKLGYRPQELIQIL